MAASPDLILRKWPGDRQFHYGADSLTDRSRLQEGFFHWGFNVINRGGDVGTRYGFRPVLTIGCGNPQGICFFRPTNGKAFLVFSVSGMVFVTKEPFDSFTRLKKIHFNPHVDHVIFKEATKALEPSGASVSPYEILMMQDGMGRAAFWDGSTDRHLDPTPDGYYNPFSKGANETIIGLQMEFVGGRLWVAKGRELFAGDIYDPLHFIENQYLFATTGFQAMDGQVINCLKRTADSKQLMVGTDDNVTAVDAGNANRASWPFSQDFIKMLFPGTGMSGPKCATDFNGEVYWASKVGYHAYNAVGSSVFQAKRKILSHELDKDFKVMSPLKNRICAGAFDSYALFGAPVGDQYNRHIHVLDSSTSDIMTQQFPYAWQGAWTGIRPVEFASGVVDGENRCFCLSMDRDMVRIWEMFDMSKRDNTDRDIECYVDTRGFSGGNDLSYKKLKFAEIHTKDLIGHATMKAFWKNEFTCYKEIGDWDLCAEECAVQGNCTVGGTPEAQNRHLISRNAVEEPNENGSRRKLPHGNWFAMRYSWVGVNSIWGHKVIMDQSEDQAHGDPRAAVESCKIMACCDEEPDYWSIDDETPPNYYSGPWCEIFDS